MGEIKGIQEVQSSMSKVKQAIVDHVYVLIERTFKFNDFIINVVPSTEVDGVENTHTSILLSQDGINFGEVRINSSEYLSMRVEDREKLGHITQMLSGQLHSLSLFDKPFLEFAEARTENSLFKSELNLAHSDLNTAHEELSDAYNLGVLLNRNLSRMRDDINLFLEQAPIAFGVLKYRHLKIEVANSLILQLWGKNKSVIGKPLAEALPELAGQPYLDILDEVYTTGKRYVGRESPVSLFINGAEEVVYFNFMYEPIKNKSEVPNSIMIIATDVTSIVREKLIEKT